MFKYWFVDFYKATMGFEDGWNNVGFDLRTWLYTNIKENGLPLCCYTIDVNREKYSMYSKEKRLVPFKNNYSNIILLLNVFF